MTESELVVVFLLIFAAIAVGYMTWTELPALRRSKRPDFVECALLTLSWFFLFSYGLAIALYI